MKKVLKLEEVKPLLSEVEQSVAFKTLKGLPKQYPLNVYSLDMVEVLEAYKMQHRKARLIVPRELEHLATNAFFSDKILKSLAEDSGIHQWELPHHGMKLELLPVQLFLVGLPKGYDRKEMYVRLCEYYIQHIYLNVTRRYLNTVYNRLAWDVENVTSIPNGSVFKLYDSMEEEKSFMIGLFSNPLFDGLYPATKGKILKNTSHRFKKYVKEKTWNQGQSPIISNNQ